MTEEQHAEAILLAAGYTRLAEAVPNSKALFTALRAYGDERAAEMRERAAEGASYPTALPSWAQQAGLSMSDYISAWEDGHLDHNEAIRALPLQEPKQ